VTKGSGVSVNPVDRTEMIVARQRSSHTRHAGHDFFGNTAMVAVIDMALPYSWQTPPGISRYAFPQIPSALDKISRSSDTKVSYKLCDGLYG
jgi:hypothetical protein